MLRTAYYALIAGEREQKVRIRAANGEQEVTYHAANLAILKAELAGAEAACLAKTDPNARPRRFAIQAGSRFRG